MKLPHGEVPPRPRDFKVKRTVLAAVDINGDPIVCYAIMANGRCYGHSWDKDKAIRGGLALQAEARAYWIEHEIIPELRIRRA